MTLRNITKFIYDGLFTKDSWPDDLADKVKTTPTYRICMIRVKAVLMMFLKCSIVDFPFVAEENQLCYPKSFDGNE